MDVKVCGVIFCFLFSLCFGRSFPIDTKINEKREQLNCLNSELELQKAKNEKLRKISQATDEENEEYFVKTARELNLSKHNERIFVNISGN